MGRPENEGRQIMKNGKRRMQRIMKSMGMMCLMVAFLFGGVASSEGVAVGVSATGSDKPEAKTFEAGKKVSGKVKKGKTKWYKITIPSDSKYKCVKLSYKLKGDVSFSVMDNASTTDMVMGISADISGHYSENEECYDIVDSENAGFEKIAKGHTYYFEVSAEDKDVEFSFKLDYCKSKKLKVEYGIYKNKTEVSIVVRTSTAKSCDITLKCNKKIIQKSIKINDESEWTKSETYMFRSPDGGNVFELKRRPKKGDVFTIKVKSDGYKTYTKKIKIKK